MSPDENNFKEIESFFVLKEIKEQDERTSKLTFECVKCLPKINKINSSTQAPFSNLKTHIKNKHNGFLSQFEDAVSDCKKCRNPSTSRPKSSSKTSEASTSKKSNPFELAKQSGTGVLTQREYNEAIADLITSNYLPFTITDRPGWRRFLKKVQPKRDIPCYRTNVKTIKQQHGILMSNIKKEISKAEYVAASTDGWSAMKKSFLGYTCTWLGEDLERHVAVIACRRFIGRQTYATLTPHMCEILEEFSIQNKCNGFTTDSASNYQKAFVEFGIEPLDFSNEDDDDDDKDVHENDVEIETIDIDAALDDNDDDHDENQEDLDFILPPHYKCSAHKFNNVAKQGTKRAMKEKVFSRPANVIFGKIRAIWNALSRSTKKADSIAEKCGGYFVLPGNTRWNGFYDGISDFYKKICESDDKFEALAKELQFRPFTDSEISFLKEYLMVMRPVALTLDKLQADVGLGHILPYVSKVLNYFEEMDDLTTCEPLRDSLKIEIEARFKHLFKDKIHVLAALSDPQFKDYWISDDDYKEYARDVFAKAAKKVMPQSDEPKAKVPKIDETLESFGNFGPKDDCQDKVIELYLCNTIKELNMLKNFPVVEKIYRKTNTIFASSASVERVFSRGKLVFGLNRASLSDKNFETHLLIQSNQSFLFTKE